jgi:muramidase (phage lysozyme)
MNEREFLKQFRNSPEGKKLLETISFAEGTRRPNANDSYRVMFGGGLAPNLKAHPDKVISSPGGYSSAAAGRYQFLPGTWQSQASRLGLSGFGPEEQDIAALALARNRLMPIGGLSVLQKEGLSSRVAAQLAPEWASFPTESGRSYYGQPVKPLSELQKVYQSTTPPVAPAAPGATTTQKQITKGNSLAETLIQQLIKSRIPAVLQQRSSLASPDELVSFANSMTPLPDDYLNLFS